VLGQRGIGQHLSDWITADIVELAQAAEQGERMKDARMFDRVYQTQCACS